ncbi:MAG TPA: hypothetical protein VGA73_02680 [Candidatus Binatia bacterium]
MYEVPAVYRERALWAVAGVVLLFLLFLVSGGLYAITPPNGPVDTAYVMNRLTGKVWLVKTYTKQVGNIRVLSARQAEVEKTRDVTADDTPAVAMADETPRVTRRR